MKTAVYAGSFNPITLGHQSVIERASKVFDRVVVVITNNSDKKYRFSMNERRELAQEVLEGYDNVIVLTHSGLLMTFLETNNISILIRGVRNSLDCQEELKIADVNSIISDYKIDTIMFPSLKEYIYCSSTVVRELLEYKQNIESYVDKRIIKKVENMYFINKMLDK